MKLLQKEEELARGVHVTVTNYRIVREIKGPIHDEYEEVPLSSITSLHYSKSKRVPWLAFAIIFLLIAIALLVMQYLHPMIPVASFGFAIVFFFVFLYSDTPRLLVRTNTKLFTYAGPEAQEMLLAINKAIYDDKPRKE